VVRRNYSFWKHPIKWWKDRKKITLMNFWVNKMWENGMREEVELMDLDLMMFGAAFMDKNGARVDPRQFQPSKKKVSKRKK